MSTLKNMSDVKIRNIYMATRHEMKYVVRGFILGMTFLLGLGVCAIPVMADAEHSDVASGAATVKAEEVVSYGMVPVYGRDIEDGTYEINVRSSSRFFRVLSAELTVSGDEMEAKMTMNSGSYRLLFMGSAQDAAAAPYEDYIEVGKEDGWYVVTVPVKALNTGIDCAAFSKRKKKWYDRQILFDAADIPREALHIELPDYGLIEEALTYYEEQTGNAPAVQEPEVVQEEPEEPEFKGPEGMEIDLPDGEYSVEVGLVGGSGRASVSSPTLLIVRDGRAYARILWSSSYYDYMLVGGERYLNESEEGASSSFTIPVYVMDSEMPVIADTTAMGDPVAIDYELTFYRDSVGDKGRIPQEAAKSVLIVAVAVIAGGFVLDRVIRALRKRINTR